MIPIQYRTLLLGSLILLLACFSFLANSAVTGMPWEDPLKVIVNSLTGPVALGVSIIGVAVAGVMLVFGGEMADFTRRLLMVVFAASVLMSAASVITLLFTQQGAVV